MARYNLSRCCVFPASLFCFFNLLFGHSRRDSLTNPMLINAFFYLFNPKVTRSLIMIAFCNTISLIISTLIQVCLHFYMRWQGSNYLFEVLLWKVILSQPYFGWIRMKICNPINSLAHRTIYFSQLLKANSLSETLCSQTQTAFVCSNSATITAEQITRYIQS